MVASVKAAMPGTRIIQMTDTDTKPVIGVDEVIRKRYDGRFLMPYRLLHLKDFPPTDAIFLDTDIIVQKDLAPVFSEDFDIALTRRDKPVRDPNGYDLAAEMPFNTGVMFSRPRGGVLATGLRTLPHIAKTGPGMVGRSGFNQGSCRQHWPETHGIAL